MSRTYRKSSLDYNYKYIRESIEEVENPLRDKWVKTYILGRNRDGAGCKHYGVLKWYSDKKRRANDRRMINDFYSGVDPDNLDYKNDDDLKELLWVFF